MNLSIWIVLFSFHQAQCISYIFTGVNNILHEAQHQFNQCRTSNTSRLLHWFFIYFFKIKCVSSKKISKYCLFVLFFFFSFSKSIFSSIIQTNICVVPSNYFVRHFYFLCTFQSISPIITYIVRTHKIKSLNDWAL